jgi:hypothetical protein
VELTPNGAIDSYMTFDEYLDDEKTKNFGEDVLKITPLCFSMKKLLNMIQEFFFILPKILLTINNMIARIATTKIFTPIPALNIPPKLTTCKK